VTYTNAIGCRVLAELKAQTPFGQALLRTMPFAVEFKERMKLFRAFVEVNNAERAYVSTRLPGNLHGFAVNCTRLITFLSFNVRRACRMTNAYISQKGIESSLEFAAKWFWRTGFVFWTGCMLRVAFEHQSESSLALA
jgi:hypothetical protein